MELWTLAHLSPGERDKSARDWGFFEAFFIQRLLYFRQLGFIKLRILKRDFDNEKAMGNFWEGNLSFKMHEVTFVRRNASHLFAGVQLASEGKPARFCTLGVF